MKKTYQKLIITCFLISSFVFFCGIDACVGLRFYDNGDGTITDERTGLIWLQNAECYGLQNWDNTMSSIDELNSGECGLSDGSVAGDWRLPTKDELQEIGTDPPSTWDSGYPVVTWTMPGAPFIGVQSVVYWSSTEYSTSTVWVVYMGNGCANTFGPFDAHVWPVRSAN